jgi:ribosomal protein S27E
MANPFVLAGVLGANLVAIRCPHCGHIKRVAKKPVKYRLCPRCRHQFADPMTAKKK